MTSRVTRLIGACLFCLGLMLAAIGTTKPQTLHERLQVTSSVNAGKVGIITGESGGTYMRLAEDLANHDLNTKEQFRVVPVLGLGSVQNLIDLLYLDSIDVAFVQSDVLRAVREEDLGGGLIDSALAGRKIVYIAKLYDEEIHLLVAPDIVRLHDLDGRKVAVGQVNSGSDLTSRLVFGFQGIVVDRVHMARDRAIAALRRGDVAAVFMIAGKPARLFQTLPDGTAAGLRFLELDLPKGLEDIYAETVLDHGDYPNLIKADAPVATLSVSSVMAAYKFDDGQTRRARQARFVEAFFAGIDSLKQPGSGFHEKWREVDLRAEVSDWDRFEPASSFIRDGK